MRRAVRIIVVVAMFAYGTCAFAGIHPVPLDKNTDSAKCAECHQDKAKGKFVHSAIPMGCTTCHEVRVTKDVTRIKLTTDDASGAMFHLPRRHESCRSEGDRSSSGGSRLPQVSRSTYQ